MKMTAAIEAYVVDMHREGRFRSKFSEIAYRQVLHAHADDVQNRDPRTVGRDDIKRTLARWKNPSTQNKRHSMLASFYDWVMQEGIRETNPARQVRRAKFQQVKKYKMTRDEMAALLNAAQTTRERRIIYLGVLAGIRNAELRGLQGKHFQRPGFIWISDDIGKGKRERWIPVLPELAVIVEDIRANVPYEYYVLGRGSAGGWGPHTFQREDPTRPMSSQTVQRTVHHVAGRAGIKAHIHPHLMRHAFGTHVARKIGIEMTQALMGHSDIQTTRIYTSEPMLEDLAEAIRELKFMDDFLPPSNTGHDGRDGEGGIRTLASGLVSYDGDLLELLPPQVRDRVRETVGVYIEHFSKAGA
jgi:site-specific recombinase XerD